MNTEHRNAEYIPQQIKVFSKWVKRALSNNRLDVTIKDITKDLKDGVTLVELSEVLVCKLAPRDWELQPKRSEDMIHNSELAIEMLTKNGVHLNGITGKEVTESKEKFILGLLWTIILHYSIDKSVRFSNDYNKAKKQLQILIHIKSFPLRRPEAPQAGTRAVGARPHRELPRHRRIPAIEPGFVRTPRLLLPREDQLLHARSRNSLQSCFSSIERTQHSTFV